MAPFSGGRWVHFTPARKIKKKERCDFISAVAWTGTHAQIYDQAQPEMREASFLSIEEQRKRDTGKSQDAWETHLLGEVPHTFTNDDGESIRARLIFVKSSAHQKVQVKTREKSIQKIRTGLERLQKSVAGGYYDDEKEITASVLKGFGKKGARKYFEYTIKKRGAEEIAAQPKPGRGKRRARYDFTFVFDEQAAKHDAKYDGLYVIATSVAKEKHTTDEVFTMFKEQHHIETAHHQWKAPIRLRPIFLHKPDRIESLILVQFIALMAFYLLQREYRLRSSNPKCRTTAETLIRQFAFVPVSLREQDEQVYVSIFRARAKQIAILQVLGHPDLAARPPGRPPLPAPPGEGFARTQPAKNGSRVDATETTVATGDVINGVEKIKIILSKVSTLSINSGSSCFKNLLVSLKDKSTAIATFSSTKLEISKRFSITTVTPNAWLNLTALNSKCKLTLVKSKKCSSHIIHLQTGSLRYEKLF